MVTFPSRNTQNINIQNLQTLPDYIFRILQHLATKFCSSTNLRFLFLVVVKDLVLLAYGLRYSIIQIVHLQTIKLHHLIARQVVYTAV